jgi:hypothetical protein
MNWKCTAQTLWLFMFGALIALAGCAQKSDSTFDWQKAKWQARFSNGLTLSFSDRGVAWETNSAGPALIYRPLHLQPNRFYMASVSMTYDIRDYFPGGLYIQDSQLVHVFAKEERVFKSGQETLKVVFNTGDQQNVVIALGFPNGMNASVQFDDAAIVDYEFTAQPVNSTFSSYLVDRLGLAFDQENFDQSISKVANFVNATLLCEYVYHGGNCEDQANVILSLISNRPEYVYYPKNLQEPMTIWEAYCQRSSLSLTEILLNEFRIPSHQVYMVFGGIGKHEFVEYWNPWVKQWIAIDPFFSVRYIGPRGLLGVNGISRATVASQIAAFGEFPFCVCYNDLVSLWSGMDNLETTNAYYRSYPYGAPYRAPVIGSVNSGLD